MAGGVAMCIVADGTLGEFCQSMWDPERSDVIYC
jgi:hypothetical protein